MFIGFSSLGFCGMFGSSFFEVVEIKVWWLWGEVWMGGMEMEIGNVNNFFKKFDLIGEERGCFIG